MKILLGGIPLGCDNIGDEAIIACVVKMLKESVPGVELTVATADPATAVNLGVNVVPVFGFLDIGFHGFADEVRRHDAYVWCGATGLSDYPHVGLGLLEIAQKAGVPTFVWGVGMDDDAIVNIRYPLRHTQSICARVTGNRRVTQGNSITSSLRCKVYG